MQSPLRAVSSNAVARQFDLALARDPHRWRDAWNVRITHHPPSIHFDRPIRTLPVSLTGPACALNCAHCGGHYLQHMQPIWNVQADGAKSCLISGGCDAQGRVPVTQHLQEVTHLAQGRRLNWHVGLIGEEAARTIAPLADVISFDIVGDAETAAEVYGLPVTLDAYMHTFDMLRQHALVVPHLTIGLRAGALSGEWAALRALREREVERLILIALIPTEGTPYAACSPPALTDVADVLLAARLMLPKTSLCLGCMRPRGAYRQALDELAVRAGVNGIVNPTLVAERTAQALGLRVEWGDECCALP